MPSSYPVRFDVVPPARFERAQLALRVLLLAALWLLGGALWWILLLLYAGLPLYAGVRISAKDGPQFLADERQRLSGVNGWVIALFAYVGLLVDRFPTGEAKELIKLDIDVQGNPTVGSALMRLLMSIPNAFVLAILGIAFWLVWIVSAVTILINGTHPAGLYGFQRAILRWLARLLGYHASLVEEYPPFSIDTGTLDQTEQTPG